MSASGIQTRRLRGSNTSANLPPLPSSTTLMLGSLLALEPRLVGQVGRRVVEELDHLAEVDDRIVDALVLAELMVGGVEVGEIDAVKGLDVGADAFGSSSAVEIRSSRLMDSMSKAWRIWAQPSRKICTTWARSCTGSKCVFTACGWVVTSLSASAVAKILTRIMSMAEREVSRV